MRTLLLILCFPLASAAAIPNSTTSSNQVLKALQAPHQYAVQEIYSLGPKGYKELYRISFSQNYSMPLRWKAFMVMTGIGRGKSLPEIKKVLKAKEWFMRSAGLLALEKVDQKQAVQWAKRMFRKDKAMMVRAKAIDVLRNNPSASVRKMLWKKLYSRENYHRQKSLWIRKQILSYLIDYADQKDLKKIKKTLYDRDPRLHKVAMSGLEKLTGKKPGEQLTEQAKLSFWKKNL